MNSNEIVKFMIVTQLFISVVAVFLLIVVGTYSYWIYLDLKK